MLNDSPARAVIRLLNLLFDCASLPEGLYHGAGVLPLIVSLPYRVIASFILAGRPRGFPVARDGRIHVRLNVLVSSRLWPHSNMKVETLFWRVKFPSLLPSRDGGRCCSRSNCWRTFRTPVHSLQKSRTMVGGTSTGVPSSSYTGDFAGSSSARSSAVISSVA